MSTMEKQDTPRTRRSFTEEFKADAVAMVPTGLIYSCSGGGCAGCRPGSPVPGAALGMS